MLASAILPAGYAGASMHAGGTKLWVARYDGPGHDFDKAMAIGVSPDGSTVFVTGLSHGVTSNEDYATAAYEASTGSPLWLRRYDGPGDDIDEAYALAISPDGSRVFVSGYSYGASSGPDFGTVAYDAATGSPLWLRRFDGPIHGFDTARALAVSPDGSKLFVTGASDGGQQVGWDYATVAYDAATGSPIWMRRYNGPGSSTDDARAVAVSPDGSRVFVTGYSTGASSGHDYSTVAYDAATGAPAWVRRYDGPIGGTDEAQSIAVSPDGSGVFVTGLSDLALESPDYATVAYEAATGSNIWVRRYNGPDDGWDQAYAVAVSPDGSKVFVTGQSGADSTTIAYESATGSAVWVRSVGGPGFAITESRALTVSPDGSTVYVAAYSDSGTFDYRYVTIACDASTGGVSWLRLYNGAEQNYDIALAVGVSPDGSKVFVTGYSWGPTNGDYATVAYGT